MLPHRPRAATAAGTICFLSVAWGQYLRLSSLLDDAKIGGRGGQAGCTVWIHLTFQVAVHERKVGPPGVDSGEAPPKLLVITAIGRFRTVAPLGRPRHRGLDGRVVVVEVRGHGREI